MIRPSFITRIKFALSDCTKSMCNYSRKSVQEQLIQGILHQFFGFCIQGGGCFVQKQNWGILEYCSCYGKPLSLPSTQFTSPIADNRVKSVFAGANEVIRICNLTGLKNLFILYFWFPNKRFSLIVSLNRCAS